MVETHKIAAIEQDLPIPEKARARVRALRDTARQARNGGVFVALAAPFAKERDEAARQAALREMSLRLAQAAYMLDTAAENLTAAYSCNNYVEMSRKRLTNM